MYTAVVNMNPCNRLFYLTDLSQLSFSIIVLFVELSVAYSIRPLLLNENLTITTIFLFCSCVKLAQGRSHGASYFALLLSLQVLHYFCRFSLLWYLA